jgi:hypothetical protein
LRDNGAPPSSNNTQMASCNDDNDSDIIVWRKQRTDMNAPTMNKQQVLRDASRQPGRPHE